MVLRRLIIALLALTGFCFAQGDHSTVVQIQNNGTPVFTGKKFVPLNCSTGMTCSVSGGVVNMTASGGGGGTSTSPTSLIPAAVTSLDAYGDSITIGYGLPDVPYGNSSLASPAICWPQQVASIVGLPLGNNFGVSGARIGDSGLYTTALTKSPSASVGSIVLPGANDATDSAANNGNTVSYAQGVEALAAWLALPASLKVTDSSIVYSGTWTQSTQFGQSTHFATGTGNTATASGVNGTVIYVAGFQKPSSAQGSFTLTVDGTGQGTFGPITPAGATSTYIYPYVVRITGVASGSHTIVVTPTTGSTVDIQWIGGNGGASQAPFVAVGATIPHAGINQTVINSMNSDVQGDITALAGDGLNVVYVDNSTAVSLPVSTTTIPQYQSDDIHPNTVGATLIAKKWGEALLQTITYPGTNGVNADFYVQQLLKAGITPEKITAGIQTFINAGQFAVKQGIGGPSSSVASAQGDLYTNDSGGGGFTLWVKETGGNANTGWAAAQTENAFVDLTAQGANVAATTLFTVPAVNPFAGGQLYRVSALALVSRAATTSSTLPSVVITWTDAESGTGQTATLTATSAGNSLTTQQQSSLIIKAASNTVIQYSTTGYATSGATSMQYAVHVRLGAM